MVRKLTLKEVKDFLEKRYNVKLEEDIIDKKDVMSTKNIKKLPNDDKTIWIDFKHYDELIKEEEQRDISGDKDDN